MRFLPIVKAEGKDYVLDERLQASGNPEHSGSHGRTTGSYRECRDPSPEPSAMAMRTFAESARGDHRERIGKQRGGES